MEFIRLDFESFLARSDKNSDELTRITNQLPGIGWIGGGAIRRTLIGQPLSSDFDFFFKSEDDFKSFEEQLPATLKEVRLRRRLCTFRGS